MQIVTKLYWPPDDERRGDIDYARTDARSFRTLGFLGKPMHLPDRAEFFLNSIPDTPRAS